MVGATIEAIECGRRYCMRKTASVTVTLPWELLHRLEEEAISNHRSFSAEVAEKVQQGLAYQAMLSTSIKGMLKPQEEMKELSDEV